jgi:hypothetical protein
MRSLIAFITAAVAAGGAIAVAQTNQPTTPPQPITPPPTVNYGYGGYPGDYHAATAGESYARGMADVVRSQGEANLNNSAAAINYSIARTNEINNRNQWTNTYFAMRDENRRARAAERAPRPTMADLVRYAQAGKPKPLSPSQLDVVTGAIRWPLALQVDQYAKSRKELEDIFARRASSGAVTPAGYMKAREVTQAMMSQLQEHIQQIPPQQYVLAKQFLESLAYEAGRPLG